MAAAEGTPNGVDAHFDDVVLRQQQYSQSSQESLWSVSSLSDREVIQVTDAEEARTEREEALLDRVFELESELRQVRDLLKDESRGTYVSIDKDGLDSIKDSIEHGIKEAVITSIVEHIKNMPQRKYEDGTPSETLYSRLTKMESKKNVDASLRRAKAIKHFTTANAQKLRQHIEQAISRSSTLFNSPTAIVKIFSDKRLTPPENNRGRAPDKHNGITRDDLGLNTGTMFAFVYNNNIHRVKICKGNSKTVQYKNIDPCEHGIFKTRATELWSQDLLYFSRDVIPENMASKNHVMDAELLMTPGITVVDSPEKRPQHPTTPVNQGTHLNMTTPTSRDSPRPPRTPQS